MKLLAVAAALAATTLVTPGQSASGSDPEAMIRGLYARHALPEGRALDRYLARDLANAYRKDSASPDEVGAANDFDWRYGAQDVQIRDLRFARSGPVVRVSYRSFGRPYTVNWSLCRRGPGWRIADVSGQGGGETWSLRGLLKLPSPGVRC